MIPSHCKVAGRYEMAQELAKRFAQGVENPMVLRDLMVSIAHEIGLQERHDELWEMHAPTPDDIAAKGDTVPDYIANEPPCARSFQMRGF